LWRDPYRINQEQEEREQNTDIFHDFAHVGNHSQTPIASASIAPGVMRNKELVFERERERDGIDSH